MRALINSPSSVPSKSCQEKPRVDEHLPQNLKPKTKSYTLLVKECNGWNTDAMPNDYELALSLKYRENLEAPN